MEGPFGYDFLKIEFNDIYEDINNIRNCKEVEEKNKCIEILIEDIIYKIYKKNNILYNDKASYIIKLNDLESLGLMPKNIVDIIVFFVEEIIDSYIEQNNFMSSEVFKYKKRKELFQVLVWFVVTYGEENYFLFTSSLSKEEREVFDLYLPKANNIQKATLVNLEELSQEEKEEKARYLLEKGENYYLGRSVTANNVEALKYFREAVKYGNIQSQAYIGLFYERGIVVKKNYETAAKWYHKAALSGNSFAQYSLAMMYLSGNGVDNDKYKALLWFQKSAENEYAPAFYQLGRAYYYGVGTDKDTKQALKWYKKAAEEDLPSAQYVLAMMYKNGEGCNPNIVTAYYWLEKAADNEYEDAYYIIGKSYLEGVVYNQDYEKAYYYLNKGYLMADTNCIEALGDMYLKGIHVQKDKIMALDLFNKAIDLGCDELYYKVGKIYEEDGLISQAINVYEEGHREGQVKCTQRLGIIYYNGEGISRNIERAIKYMEIATKEKAPHAMYMLAIAYLRSNKFGDETDKKAKELLIEAFQLGSPYAAEYLGYITINEATEGKKINKDTLLKYIQYGIQNDISDCEFQYGYIYENGIEVKLDYEKAYEHYKNAANKNCVKAMLKIAEWYNMGRYLERNIDYAISWYEKAAELNDEEAIEKLIEIYEKGIGNRKNHVKAVYYVFKLADIDGIKAKKKLAYYCYKGIGIEENVDKANELIKEIEEIDSGSEKDLRGRLAKEGFIEMTQDEIIENYREGIELGNLECYGELAEYLYKKGLYNKQEYKEVFDVAMEGKKLGINKCIYINLMERLNKAIKEPIVTIEEVLIIKSIKKVVYKGLYYAINDLIEWYKTRNKKAKSEYYKLLEQAIYFNV